MTLLSTTLVDQHRGLQFTESPRWQHGKLWFIDIHDRRIKSLSSDGVLTTELSLPFLPNGLGLTPDGAWLFSDALARQIYRWDGQTLAPWADLSGLTTFCLSDGICDAQGRFYVGDIGYNFFDPANAPVATCVIVRVDAHGTAQVVADGLTFPNGMVITPDGRTLIVAECMAHRLTAFDIDADGALSNRRLWAELGPDVHPDGICLDADGAVWVANPEGQQQVLRVLEGGAVSDRIQLATDAYAVMLGGADRRQLFICCADSHDPAQLARTPSARIEVLQVAVAGA